MHQAYEYGMDGLAFCLEMEEVEDHHSDSDQSLAAVTQKSFNLSEALAQKAVSNQDRLSSQTHLAPPDSSDRSSQQV